MGRPVSYTKASALYNALAEFKNEDGYVMRNLTNATQTAGIALASGMPMARRLEKLGCLKIYTSELPKRKAPFVLIKITGQMPPYDEYAKSYVIE